MRARASVLGLLFAVVACERARPAPAPSAPPPPAPAWLAAKFRDSEVEPFDGYRLPGLALYALRWRAIDAGSTRIVGVAEGRRVVEGKALFVRSARARLSAEELARRALGVVVPLDDRGLTPPLDRARCERRAVYPKSRCVIVHPPRVEGGSLVFFSTRPSMMEEHLVENRVTLATGEVSTRGDIDLRLARGETVDVGEPACRALASCGEWQGCVPVVAVVAPNTERHTLFRRTDQPPGASLLIAPHLCEPSGSPCLEVCDGDRCEDALGLRDEACERTRRPSRAPFRCLTTHAPDGITCTSAPIAGP